MKRNHGREGEGEGDFLNDGERSCRARLKRRGESIFAVRFPPRVALSSAFEADVSQSKPRGLPAAVAAVAAASSSSSRGTLRPAPH